MQLVLWYMFYNFAAIITTSAYHLIPFHFYFTQHFFYGKRFSNPGSKLL